MHITPSNPRKQYRRGRLTANTATSTRASVLNVVTPPVDSRILSRLASSAADNSAAAGGMAVGSKTSRSDTESSGEISRTQSELTALKEEERGGGDRTKAMRRPSWLHTMFLGAPGGCEAEGGWGGERER
jgi:hypothetical protein